MEKILLKTALYSFVLSFVVSFIFYPREVPLGSGASEMIPYTEYFFIIARYSAISMSVSLLVVFAYLMVLRSNKQSV
ncbi:hypothetical protein [Pseudalkalibacillus sp. SCS-8]|uniref:hypothetical protein n=1 Tax=Pseudalkalibacillus nanhaiensis TaxID=3115291 RepID=UPI0032DB9E64